MPDDPVLEEEFQILIGGKPYTAADLSFREQRELRTVVRRLMDDPEGDIAASELMDFAPALIYVVTRRENPDFTIEEALDMKHGDILQPAKRNGDGGPPTKARRSTKSKTT